MIVLFVLFNIYPKVQQFGSRFVSDCLDPGCVVARPLFFAIGAEGSRRGTGGSGRRGRRLGGLRRPASPPTAKSLSSQRITGVMFLLVPRPSA